MCRSRKVAPVGGSSTGAWRDQGEGVCRMPGLPSIQVRYFHGIPMTFNRPIIMVVSALVPCGKMWIRRTGKARWRFFGRFGL